LRGDGFPPRRVDSHNESQSSKDGSQSRKIGGYEEFGGQSRRNKGHSGASKKSLTRRL
jgi:hypothetical protein